MSHVSYPTEFIRRIHESSRRLVLAVTGGGSQAIAALLEVPGASRTVLEAIVPYSAPSLTAFLGARPEQFCSQRTARAMAMAAYQRALRYANAEEASPESAAGVACTASLASDRPKHGPHRIHAAMQTAETTTAHSVELVKGRRSREDEERAAAAIVLNLVAEACGITERIDTGLQTDERLQVVRSQPPENWRRLLSGRCDAVAARSIAAHAAGRRVIFPGAFNPRHEAHRRMAQIAAELMRLPVEYEISILNVDKPPLDYIELEQRVAQFAADERVWLTRAATFVEKAAKFAPATFIVGADTIARIADARYYGGEPACRAARDCLANSGCRFLVFGRQINGCFTHLPHALGLPDDLLRLCEFVPAETFRHDVSSTELRRAESAGLGQKTE